MIKKPVTIRNSMDMETRPIAHLVQEVRYISRWMIRRLTQRVLWE